MWRLTARDRDILRKVIPTELMKKPIQLDPSIRSNSIETIDDLSKKSHLSAAELEAIYNVLPPETEFYRFVEALRPSSSVEIAKESEERMSKEQRQAKREYRERLEQLRQKQEEKQYMEMTRSIDPTRVRPLIQDFGKEMREVNRQLIAVMNTVITVGGSFAFGFFGVQYAYPHLDLDIATRMLLGLVLGTVVFFADLYFLVKGMDLDEQNDEHKKPTSF